MELIDRDVLLNKLPNCDFEKDEKISKIGAIADMVILVCDAPAIDAVPVVRCKDCKHFIGANDHDGYVTAIGYCNHINHHIMPCVFDFYCADGERKEVQDGQ